MVIYSVCVCGREKGTAMVEKLGTNSSFAQFDINDIKSLETALQGKGAIFIISVQVL